MGLFIIGLGLGSERDITLRGLELVQRSRRVYLEHYTSKFFCSPEKVEGVVGREVVVAHREDVEGEGDRDSHILEEAVSEDVALLVVGSPLFATTHSELVIRGRELGVEVRVVHNASIQSVFGSCGLFSYSFGRTVTIPFFTATWKPLSFYENILGNLESGLHTLCLLDIKIREPTLETMMGREKKYLPDRFMSAREGLLQVREAMEIRGSRELEGREIVAVERFGSESEAYHLGRIEELLEVEYGGPLHSLIVPSFENRMERECVERFFGRRRGSG